MQNAKLQFKIQKVKNLFHLGEVLTAQIIYGFPSKRLKVIGVTGTDGKTTTTHLIYHILKQAHKKVSMISTVYAKIADSIHDTGLHTTTPGRLSIPRFLNKAVKNGDEFFVLEITSHALDQFRDFGNRYYISVLTNVTHEHLDYHPTYEDYVKIKARLLLRSSTPIINRDDRSYSRLKTILKQTGKSYLTYGLGHNADFSLDLDPKATQFNKYNFLAAYAATRLIGIPDHTIRQAIASFALPPGRMEIVQSKPFTVIIDFAHTPNAIEILLKSICELYKKRGRIIHVFGSAGLRDATKRPLMGEASGIYADIVILTEEDYRTEKPDNIARQIAEGLEKHGFVKDKRYFVILDRRIAIHRAIAMAKPNDIVVITGKGHEKSLCRGKIEHPWDERRVVVEALQLNLKTQMSNVK